MRFQYVIQHVPGKTLYTADTLSRAPLKEIPDANSSTSSQEIEQFVQAITAAFPASPDRLDSYSKAQAEDSICSRLIEYCTSGWPNRSKLSRELKGGIVANLLLVELCYCTNLGLLFPRV